MPRVTIRTGFVGEDGQEEVLTEYLCDWPDCPNVAEQGLGVVCELRIMSAVCHEHAAMAHKRASDGGHD